MGTGRRHRTTGASANPAAEVMYPTTSSKSSSSKKPSCQVGSGGLAYASGVSVRMHAMKNSTSPFREACVRTD